MLSFYPGRGDNSHELASLAHDENTGSHLPEVDDEGAETDEDPADEEQTLELALRFPDKFSESLAIEVKKKPLSSSISTGLWYSHRGHLGRHLEGLRLVIRLARAQVFCSATLACRR